jgi:hypothetical protein
VDPCRKPLSWGYWGASEDMWLGGNGHEESFEKQYLSKGSTHNFCSILSGARNFLGGYDIIPQEISISYGRN